MLLIRRSMCCVNPSPGGGEIPSIGYIQSPGWGVHCLSKVGNFVLDIPEDVSRTAGRSGGVSIHAGVALRGRSGAARVGVNILIHLELSGGKANVLAMESK